MEKCLSDKELLEWVDHKAKLVKYPDLINYDSIFDALGEHGAMILFYETSPNFGHWTCCLLKEDNDGKYIEHFDSYGVKPDDELNFIPIQFRKINYEYHPQYTALLLKSGLPVTYSQYKLQAKKVITKVGSSSLLGQTCPSLRDKEITSEVNTCGRWVAWRIFFKDNDISDFADTFESISKELNLPMDYILSELGPPL
jgi:hypothetical protein